LDKNVHRYAVRREKINILEREREIEIEREGKGKRALNMY
jgi:hypothetical protein